MIAHRPPCALSVARDSAVCATSGSWAPLASSTRSVRAPAPGVGVMLGVPVGLGLGEALLVAVAVAVAPWVGVEVAPGVAEAVAAGVDVALACAVGVAVGVLGRAVGVAVGLDAGADDGVLVAAAISAPNISPSLSMADVSPLVAGVSVDPAVRVGSGVLVASAVPRLAGVVLGVAASGVAVALGLADAVGCGCAPPAPARAGPSANCRVIPVSDGVLAAGAVCARTSLGVDHAGRLATAAAEPRPALSSQRRPTGVAISRCRNDSCSLSRVR